MINIKLQPVVQDAAAAFLYDNTPEDSPLVFSVAFMFTTMPGKEMRLPDVKHTTEVLPGLNCRLWFVQADMTSAQVEAYTGMLSSHDTYYECVITGLVG